MPDDIRPAFGPRPPLKASEPPRGPAASAVPALVVAAAFKLELKPLLRMAERLSLIPAPVGVWAWVGWLGGQPLLVLRTGMGAEAVGRALSGLEGRPLAALISGGTCGALKPGLKRGSLLVPERIIQELEGGRAGEPYLCHGSLVKQALAAAGELGVPLEQIGALLCRQAVASEPALKRRLAQEFAAAAVDMESAAVADYAARRGVPFLALKVVADEAAGWMLPLDGWGWLAHPIRRTLRLPLYLGGLARTAAGWPEIRRGLGAGAQVMAALASAAPWARGSGRCPAARSAAGSR